MVRSRVNKSGAGDDNHGKCENHAETVVPDKTRTSQTLARGLMLLNCFQANRSAVEIGRSSEGLQPGLELGIKDLAQKLDLPQTVVSRLTATLVDYGYLYQNPATRKYRLGLAAFTLGLVADPHMELKHAARRFMEKLARETGESVSLTVVDSGTGDGLCIASLDSPNPIKLTTVVGSLLPLHRGATRKVLLAYLPQAQNQDYLDRLELSGEERAILEAELTTIARQGYAYSEQELDEGAFAVAAPIVTQTDVLLGGLAVLGPLFRHTEAERAAWIEVVRQAAIQIGHGWDFCGTARPSRLIDSRETPTATCLVGGDEV